MLTILRRLCSVIMLAVLMCACTPNDSAPPEPPPPPPAPERWSGLVSDLRMQWSAEDGIDLLTGVAVPLRAYFESMKLVEYTGDEADVYPGFTHAVLPNDPNGPASARDRQPNTAVPLNKPIVGTMYAHILRVEKTDRDVTAIICKYEYTTAQPDGYGSYLVPGQWRNQRDPNSGISAYLVTMLAPEHPPEQPLPPQKGPEPAPAIDVFGNWIITGHLNS